jgi:DUF4097 and DUF4098 domain-containing protein YvlB
MLKTIALTLCYAGVLLAQGGPDKVTVPLHDPSRPAQIHAHLLTGSITVRGADIRDVVVETRSRGHEESRGFRPERSDGMKRLDLGNSGLDVVEDNNVVDIKTAPWSTPADLVITVPLRSSLQLGSVNAGNINVEHVDGEIDANDLNGNITLKDVAGSVVAHSLNGQVVATLDRIDPSKPMSFSTLNGNIDVTLPGNVKANLRMKTDNGSIYSDFDVKLNSGASIEQSEPAHREEGKYHVRFDRTLRGSINGGGPELQFTTFNGHIYIRKGK